MFFFKTVGDHCGGICNDIDVHQFLKKFKKGIEYLFLYETGYKYLIRFERVFNLPTVYNF